MVVIEVVFLALFWSAACSAVLFLRNTLLPRLPLTQTPAQFNLPFETVQFDATDGVRLEGWKISGDPGRRWIILCHGVGSNRADLLDIAAGLHAASFNVLLFDFRGHGGSAGWTTSFGWQEQRDLEGALAFLGRQPEVPALPYGIYGISMGGAVTLMVAAKDERLGAMAVDSPYTSLEATLGRHLRLLYPIIPTVPFLWFILATYRVRFGVWPRQVSPYEAVGHLSPRALLLIHGSVDPRMPRAGTQRMFERAEEPKALWIIEGAGHLESFGKDPQHYLARLSEFFTRHLTP